MIYAVIDTNVLVAAVLTHNPESPTVRIVDGLFLHEYVIMYDDDIIKEYREVLSRKKFNIREEHVNNLIAFIITNGVSSNRLAFDQPMVDEKDRVFYEVAFSCEDSYLVTGNLKHFPKEPRVVTPAEMVKILKSQKGDQIQG